MFEEKSAGRYLSYSILEYYKLLKIIRIKD